MQDLLSSDSEKDPGGRPRAEIPLEEVEKLGSFGCTIEDIAGFFGVSSKTVFRRVESEPEFARAYERGRANMRCSLRRKQISVAMEGNYTMLIWCGKQYLGQHDRIEMEHSGALNVSDARDTLNSRIASLAARIGKAEDDSGTVQ